MWRSSCRNDEVFLKAADRSAGGSEHMCMALYFRSRASRASQFGLAIVAWIITSGAAETAKAADTPANHSAAPAALSVDELTGRIDSYFDQFWLKHAIEPSAAADDAEFFRRLHLDLCGKIPLPGDALQFLGAAKQDKRAKKIAELLTSGPFAQHYAATLRAALLGGSADKPEVDIWIPQLDAWLRLRLAAQTPLDQMVRELLSSNPAGQDESSITAVSRLPRPMAFWLAGEGKPELMAANTSRVFLGLQVGCAECHDHPHSHWKQTEFWSFAALFKEPAPARSNGSLGTMLLTAFDQAAAKPSNSNSALTVAAEPVFLDGSRPDLHDGRSKRQVLAEWLTADANPWFAQALVNRIWSTFLGRGLIDPVDDLEAAGPDDHPQLLALLAEQLRAHHYDVRYLIQAIVSTRAYQLSSKPAATTQAFASMPLRRLSAEQLLASLLVAAGNPQWVASGAGAEDGMADLRGQFLAKFRELNVAPTEADTTILQALALMNCKLTTLLTDPRRSPTLGAVAGAEFLSPEERIDALFLATLTRHASEDERRVFVEGLRSTAIGRDPAAPLGDAFWALLNSAEFNVNH
jgi:hypothetical protein